MANSTQIIDNLRCGVWFTDTTVKQPLCQHGQGKPLTEGLSSTQTNKALFKTQRREEEDQEDEEEEEKQRNLSAPSKNEDRRNGLYIGGACCQCVVARCQCVAAQSGHRAVCTPDDTAPAE
jgi:hypothetical protein